MQSIILQDNLIWVTFRPNLFYAFFERIPVVTKSVFTAKYEHLRKRLIVARKAAGLTQVELAERLGRPQSFASKYERGERRLDVVEFLEVAKAIGIAPVALIVQLEREA